MPSHPPLDGVLVGQVGSWCRGKREDGKKAKLETAKPPHFAVGRPDFLARYRGVSYVGILMR
jgi:hypothetical protein